MTAAQFGILGPLEVNIDGEPVEIAAMQLRRLLCVLLLAPGRPVSIDKATECLWPTDVEGVERPKNPAKTLRIYCSRLRHVLPEDAGPKSDVRGYRLNIDPEDLDTVRFEQLLEVGQRKAGTDPVSGTQLLREAIDIWRGPALADCRDEFWAASAAARLDELKLRALEKLIEARLALGEHTSVYPDLDHLVEQHPLRESLWAHLMLALYRSGRQADALRTFQRLRQHLGEELGIEPRREMFDLESAILTQDPGLDLAPSVEPDVPPEPVSTTPSEPSPQPVVRRAVVPAQVTSFVGRTHELTEVYELACRSRLVTMSGPGGVGKTRLAIAVAERLAAGSPDGVLFVDLASLRDPKDVHAFVASLLGVRVRTEATILVDIVAALGDDNVTLLLDNCEHVRAPCAILAEELLASCPGLSILATSREPLAVAGEVLYRVPPLGVPPAGTEDADGVGAEDAARLFAERARAQRPSFSLTSANAPLVGSLCRRLDGVPLALELAAARLGSLSLGDIHARLDERFKLLTRENRTGPARHRALDALIGWSYDLLGDSERALLRRLAAFPAGFGIAAVIAVAGGELDEWSVLEDLSSLVEKSLVLADTSGPSARYTLLESIREFAQARLQEEDGPEILARLRGKHASHYRDLVENLAPQLRTMEHASHFELIEAEFPNIRSAFSYFLEQPARTRDAMRIVASFLRYVGWGGHEAEILSFTDLLQGRPELDEPDELAVRVWLVRLNLLTRRDPASAADPYRRSLDTALSLGERCLAVDCMQGLGWLATMTGELADAGRWHREAVAMARAIGDPFTLGVALNGACAPVEDRREALQLFEDLADPMGTFAALHNIGAELNDKGDSVGAHAYFERAMSYHSRMWPGREDPTLLLNLGTSLVLNSAHEQARDVFRRSVETSRRQLYELKVAYGLCGVAMCAGRDGDLILAATLFGAAEQFLERGGFGLPDIEGALVRSEEERVGSELGQGRYDDAARSGRRLSRDDAVALALGRLGPVVPVH